ncbi:TLD-domain-containing protein [Abortiporus biennis]|nr:TLD-domain-containing protein [Abortiporus biennis]
MPEIQRTQSFFVPSSLTAPSFPSRWVSSFLSRQSSPPQRPSPSKSPSENTILPSSTRVASPSLEISHSRAHTIIAPPAPEITHGTPFASHPYIPPSGAPGFTGDRTWNTAGFEFDKENVEKKSVKLLGRKEVTSPVLTVELANKLRPHFPALSRLPGSWTLLYSLDQHGISLKTLYSKCDSHLGGTLIIMRDTNEAVFGAWMGEGVHPSKGSYYGSGESFLWKEMSDHKVKIFKWTGKNDYFALCEPDYISFGGGEGRYGLYLDDTLSEGSSARCPTFDNDPLCSDGPRQGGSTTFECVGVEVWGVG